MSKIWRLLKIGYAVLLSPILWFTYSYLPKLHSSIAKPTITGQFDKKFQHFVIHKVRNLDTKQLSPEEFISDVNKEMCRLVETGVLDQYLRKDVLPEQNIDENLLICEGYTPFKRWYVKLHYMAVGNKHGLHAHRDVISTQVIAKGKTHIQEFNRITSLKSSPVLLEKVRDEIVSSIAGFTTTEQVNNVHGFEPVDGPMIRFQFYHRGHLGFWRTVFPERGRLYVHLMKETAPNIFEARIGRSGRTGES